MKVTIGPPGRGRQVYKHRLVAGVADEPGRNKVVDHRNNRKSDNRRSNLRVVTRAQNTAKRNRTYR